ncbi:MAG: 2-C-methyl-D-erythritol 4-phosphate cytidylyltransferase [bacterium]|jgi:2-C-methyl-D-erythritol 4-phosphate cytidylyltransferase
MRVGVIIAAAGKSTRFGAGDKLSQDLGGRPVLLRTVEAFTKRDEVTAIVVAAPPDDIENFRARFGPALGFNGAKIVEGGRTERWESIERAIRALPDDITHIAVHDGARPCISNELLSRVFAAAEVAPAVIPGIPVRDTLKRVADEQVTAAADDAIADLILGDLGKSSTSGRRVLETVPRDGLCQIQTPQVFDAALLRRAYATVDLAGTTDDASVVERLGETVLVVEGDARNIKITAEEDLQLVRALMR